MAEPATVGRRVLASLDAGRAKAIEQAKEQAAPRRAAVLDEYRKDKLRGNGDRGRPGRIHSQLKHRFQVTERTIARDIDTLFSLSK